MISAAAEERPGAVSASKRKGLRLRLGMWIAVALVFAAQVALVLWLGNPPPAPPSRPTASTIIHLGARGSDELLALQDPTLFVLPQRNNFSGAAWLKILPQPFEPARWTEAALPLPLPPEQLGAAFAAFMETNPPPRFQTDIGSPLDLADIIDLQSRPMASISLPSSVRVEGDLAKLRLLTPVQLPPQTNSDLLANTVVQLLVNAQGNPFSAIVVESCGNADTDTNALNFAKNARFEPLKPAALGTVVPNRMIFGKLIFEWQTVPPAPTNAPAGAP